MRIPREIRNNLRFLIAEVSSQVSSLRDSFRDSSIADARRVLEVMRVHPLGRQAAIIGEVVEDPHGFVQMQTSFGGSRVVDWLAGEQLPRIC